MRKFVVRLAFFLSPGFLLIPPVWVLSISKENYSSLKESVKGSAPYLVGYAYNERNYKYLKWSEVVSSSKKEILALGSSRVLAFRKELFKKSFYNAGYTIDKISEFKAFLESVPKEKHPEVLLINLDPWWFHSSVTEKNQKASIVRWKNSFTKYASFQTLFGVWKDLLNGKYSFSQIVESARDSRVNKVGLNAHINDKGFRRDGSMNYGSQISKLLKGDETANDFNFSSTLWRIEKGRGRFSYGENLSLVALKSLSDFLEYCKKRKIFVVAFLPPFAGKVDAVMKKSRRYQYIEKIFSELRLIFRKHSFEIWDVTDASAYASSDDEFLDGFHGGELTYHKLLLHVLGQGSFLNNVSNEQELSLALKNKLNRFRVYPNLAIE